jgi:DNA-binding NarL/FixJ family response regulator
MTNAEAADVLYLGAATVKSHMDHIFLKTGTTQRAAAVAVAMRNGWLT